MSWGKLKSEAGVSFIEVFFAMVMILLAVALFMESLSNTSSEFENLSDRLVANQIMQEHVSNLKTMSGQFPLVQNSEGKPGLYVACSDRHAVPTRDLKGRPLEFITFDTKPGEVSGKCIGSEVESQFSPSQTKVSELMMYVLLFSKKGKFVSMHKQQIRLERNI